MWPYLPIARREAIITVNRAVQLSQVTPDTAFANQHGESSYSSDDSHSSDDPVDTIHLTHPKDHSILSVGDRSGQADKSLDDATTLVEMTTHSNAVHDHSANASNQDDHASVQHENVLSSQPMW